MEIFLWIMIIIAGAACWWALLLTAIIMVKKFLSNTDIALKSRDDYITIWIAGPFSFIVIIAYVIYSLFGILVDKWFMEDEE